MLQCFIIPKFVHVCISEDYVASGLTSTPLTLAAHGGVAPARHRTADAPVWTPAGQGNRLHCLSDLHRVEQLDQHDVIVQSLVVIATGTGAR